jgi:hypothetical protein
MPKMMKGIAVSFPAGVNAKGGTLRNTLLSDDLPVTAVRVIDWIIDDAGRDRVEVHVRDGVPEVTR